MVTIKDIAKRAGVSRGTVDRVLNNRPGVNPETEARVRALIEEMGYRPNMAGQMLAVKKRRLHLAFLIFHGPEFVFHLDILHAARDATLHGVPILGVNMGSVGFMAELERTELSLLVPLAQGHFVTEERMMLDVRVFRGGRPVSQDLALNDAVFSKGSMARVAEVEVWADQTLVQRIMGDGVIVATPTGSTAYSMSAGGPIVEPSSQCLIVTPVCAHQLAARALVLEPNRRVVVQLPRGNRKHLYLSVDGGKAIRLTGGERVEITRSQYKTQLVQLSGRSFYEIINQKLGGYTP